MFLCEWTPITISLLLVGKTVETERIFYGTFRVLSLFALTTICACLVILKYARISKIPTVSVALITISAFIGFLTDFFIFPISLCWAAMFTLVSSTTILAHKNVQVTKWSINHLLSLKYKVMGSLIMCLLGWTAIGLDIQSMERNMTFVIGFAGFFLLFFVCRSKDSLKSLCAFGELQRGATLMCAMAKANKKP